MYQIRLIYITYYYSEVYKLFYNILTASLNCYGTKYKCHNMRETISNVYASRYNSIQFVDGPK